MKHKTIFFFVWFFCLASVDANAGMFERARTEVSGWADKIQHQLISDDKAPDTQTVPMPLPEGLPAQWRAEYVTEPVLGSRMLVVEAGDAKNETVVLVHGLGQLGFRDWLTVIPVLEKRYHVITFDFPGFGSSQAPAGRYSPENYARIVNALLLQRGIAKAVVVGHSMGGAVTLRLGARYPERVSKLVLVDAAGILQRTAFVKHSAEFAQDPDTAPQFLKKAAYYLQDVKDTLIEMSASAPDPTAYLSQHQQVWNKVLKDTPNMNAALALIEENFSADIPSINVPVFIIWGSKDAVAPLRTGFLLAGRLPEAQLNVIHGATHVPMKSHPDEFNALLLSALSASAVAPGDAPPQQDGAAVKTATAALHCKNQVGNTYRGIYTSVLIENCVGSKLVDVVTGSLKVVDSVVELQHVLVVSDAIALDAVESVVVGTDVKLQGNVGILSSGSRLDLAGVSVQGAEKAVEVTTRSRLIFSVSDIESPVYSGFVHGEFRIGHAGLDMVIKTQAQALAAGN